MKTDLTTTGSFAQAKKAALKPSLDATSTLPQKPVSTSKEASPDYKVELSSKSLTPDVPKVEIPHKLDASAKEMAREKLSGDIKTEVVKKLEPKDGSVRKPAIIFIKGLDLFSSPSKSESGYAGVGRMAEGVEGSKVFKWDQKEEIMKTIKKVHPDYPVILVGHSLGGDTAVDIANTLDSIDHKFRPVDLLITMDAVGFSNDIIPQNVKQHLNVFGENNILLNDGPHVARNHEKTSVKNILSSLEHTELDDSKEIQFEVVSYIQKVLSQ